MRAAATSLHPSGGPMHEATSLTSLDELEDLLKSLNERLTFIEKVILPSRVTKEELHGGVGDAKIFAMQRAAATLNELRRVQQQMATKEDLSQLQDSMSKQLAARGSRSRKHT